MGKGNSGMGQGLTGSKAVNEIANLKKYSEISVSYTVANNKYTDNFKKTYADTGFGQSAWFWVKTGGNGYMNSFAPNKDTIAQVLPPGATVDIKKRK